MKAENVKIILMEGFYDPKPAEFVAGETGTKIVIAALSINQESYAKDYITLIDGVVNKLVEAAK